MGTIRNYINIEGMVSEKELCKNEKGHTIIYSDIETLFIPKDKPDIKNIYEILMSVDTVSHRAINTPLGKIIVVDGIKKLKIIYIEDDSSEKVSILNLETPFNTFTEYPEELDNFWNIKVHILDAYFSLIDSKKIYCHFLYLLEVYYETDNEKNSMKNLPSKKHDSKDGNEIQVKSEPFKNMFEELSISKGLEKENIKHSLIDIDEEILWGDILWKYVTME